MLPSIHPAIHLSIHPSINPSISPSIHPSNLPSIPKSHAADASNLFLIRPDMKGSCVDSLHLIAMHICLCVDRSPIQPIPTTQPHLPCLRPRPTLRLCFCTKQTLVTFVFLSPIGLVGQFPFVDKLPDSGSFNKDTNFRFSIGRRSADQQPTD